MKQILSIFIIFLFSQLAAQDTIIKSPLSYPFAIKGFAFVIVGEGWYYSYSIGAEARIGNRLTIESVYQNRNEIGDNEFYRNIAVLSLKYYIKEKKSRTRRLYTGPAYRYSHTRQIPDQSEIKELIYQINSLGWHFGANVKPKGRFFFDISTGPHICFISDTDARFRDTFSPLMAHFVFLISDYLTWHTNIRLGFKIGKITD